MTSQLNFFDGSSDKHESVSSVLEGLRYRKELISSAEEYALVARVERLPFREFEFHGYLGKRRVVSFGGNMITPDVSSGKPMRSPSFCSLCARSPQSSPDWILVNYNKCLSRSTARGQESGGTVIKRFLVKWLASRCSLLACCASDGKW